MIILRVELLNIDREKMLGTPVCPPERQRRGRGQRIMIGLILRILLLCR